jgi:hypothetical protein
MKFNLDEKVHIIPLDLPGRITQIAITNRGTKFEVRYFWNSEIKEGWFYEDELLGRTK